MNWQYIFNLTQLLGKDLLNHPLEYIILVILVVIGIRVALRISHFLYMSFRIAPTMVNLKVTLPREESPKDKEKSEEKDFKEKIAVMEQFFRNLHELGELSLRNLIRSKFLKDDVISFELVAKDKVVDFYVVIQKRYQELLEKQITSYYPNADINTTDNLEIQPKGNRLKCYYAYQKNPYFYPITTYPNLQNDPLNDLTNIFSKLDDTDVAVIQIVIRPHKGRKWQKKAEKAGASMFAGKKPNAIKIPGLGFLRSFITALFFGAEKMTESKPEESSGPYGGGGYVRMLQTREEIAKKIGEKAGHVTFDTIVRVIGSAKTVSRAQELTNNIALGLNLFKDAQMNWFQTRRICLSTLLITQ